MLKKKIWDLLSLIEVPEATAKSFRTVFMVMDSRGVGSPIRVVLSMNWVWERGGIMLFIVRPLREKELIALVIDLLSP